MGKPAKVARFASHLKPRSPGLWEFRRNDQLLVDAARKDILRLLSDPYYAEAYQRLQRERPLPVQLKLRSGRHVGSLATNVQGTVRTAEAANKPEHDPRRKVRSPLARLVLAISYSQHWTIPEAARFALSNLSRSALGRWIGERNIDGTWIPKHEKEARSMWQQVAKAARYERGRGREWEKIGPHTTFRQLRNAESVKRTPGRK